MLEFGKRYSTIPQHEHAIYLIKFIFMGGIFSLLSSIHWFVFAGLSRRITSNTLTGIIGVLILAGDAYIRIRAVFFPQSSTDAVAVGFIPIVIGIPALIIYSLIGFSGSKASIDSLPKKEEIRTSGNIGTGGNIESNNKKYCISCGAEVKTTDNFCMKCGKRIVEDAVHGTKTR